MAEIQNLNSPSFSNLSPEIQLFQTLAGEIADDIYVVDKNTYRLLYCQIAGNRLGHVSGKRPVWSSSR